MLTNLGWINGITAACIVICACVFGFLFLYRGLRLNAKLLTYAGLIVFFTGLLYLGPCVDFFTILFTNSNLDNSYGLYGILSYIWIAPGIVSMMYVGIELILPKIRYYIIIIYSILGIIFFILVVFNTEGTFDFQEPTIPGTNMIDSNFKNGSLGYLIILIFIISIIGFNVIGSLYRSIQSSGIIRKKFLYLSLGFLIFVVLGTFDTLFSPGLFLFLIRLGSLTSWFFYFFGLKEAPTKHIVKIHEKIQYLKDFDLSLVENLLKTRTSELIEEEIVQYKEKKICLICKGRVSGFNTYICPNCDVFYCEKCAKALVELENICWVCKNPIDKSKPIIRLDDNDIVIIKRSMKQKYKTDSKRYKNGIS